VELFVMLNWIWQDEGSFDNDKSSDNVAEEFNEDDDDDASYTDAISSFAHLITF